MDVVCVAELPWSCTSGFSQLVKLYFIAFGPEKRVVDVFMRSTNTEVGVSIAALFVLLVLPKDKWNCLCCDLEDGETIGNLELVKRGASLRGKSLGMTWSRCRGRWQVIRLWF